MEFGDVPASYEPGDAAHRLGVSPSGLRRLAAAYEDVYGDLPRKVGTKARLYPEDVLGRIAQARSLVDAGRYGSNAEALDALKRGLEPKPPAELAEATDQPTPQALALFAQEQRDTLNRIEAALARLEAAERSLGALPELGAQEGPKAQHGPLVQAAIWLEGLLRGRR